MNFLSFAGITREGPAAHAAIDRRLDRLLDIGRRAHERLRENLRADPRFASTICMAMGCATDECGQEMPELEARTNLVPDVMNKIIDAG